MKTAISTSGVRSIRRADAGRRSRRILASLALVVVLLLVAIKAAAQTVPDGTGADAAAVTVEANDAGSPDAGANDSAATDAGAADAGAIEEEPTGIGVAPFIVPAYQDETSFLVGAAAVGFYHHAEREHRRDSQVLLAGAASLRKQFTALLSPDLYLEGDRFHLGGTISAARFPDRFYGIESQERRPTSASAYAEEKYTPVYVELETSPKIRVLDDAYVYVGPAVRWQYADIVERTDDGRLARDGVTGAQGGNTFQLGARAFWDARDSTLYPTRGVFIELSSLVADSKLASDFSFTRTKLDAKQYLRGPFARHVLALQEIFEVRTGDAPFYDVGKLGGSRLLRGHFEGRHRDAQVVAAQIEYRFPIVWRFGGVAFAGAGMVSNAIDRFDAAKLYAAGGGGLRFAPSPKAPVNVRLDVAYGDEPRFYLDVGEAF